MKQSKPRYRHELKYLLSAWEAETLSARIRDVAALDRNAADGEYMIRSLYFDDMWNSAYEGKLGGIGVREKYRIRIYNCEDSVIKLECKRKRGQYIHKAAASLTRGETEAILSGSFEFLRDRKELVCKEFYLKCLCDGMKPRVIVDYERQPFVGQAGEVRITLDRRVRVGILSFDLFDKGLPCLECLEETQVVLEVKFTEFLPQVFRNMLPPQNAELTAFSKYVVCCEKRDTLLM